MLLRSLYAVTALVVFSVTSANAGISLSSTRVIFEANDKEASVSVRNQGAQEILLQSWLEVEEGSEQIVPFAVTPPLARMDGNGRQLLRILFQGKGVPSDRESVFWLNVQEIPKTSANANTLQLAVRQRIKLFYRPAQLVGEAADASSKLKWQMLAEGKNSVLQVENPSPYHVSIAELDVVGSNYASNASSSRMIAPGEMARIEMNPVTDSSPLTLSFRSINDFGGLDHYRVVLDALQPVQAIRAEH
ncbi:P pilus assembly protein, chaperone PapD [Pseudomonas sp. LAMO17WK12:I10]|uniref:fimbrial biogenesis chaperone n=1 Tax=unclassified Pseudomonas TaxID=196821 RepID=UPI000BD3C762|nr:MULTISPECIES: molecular chaperone [unclassified Pseudomonas]PXX73155.1 P pilus assembly chaperone PapD [Pseudomonas sp. LAMO17WK12:I9]SNY28813.1 P pilus assembly protein, chaperone PapD [Pseudomonas sp. LAMO17WK12:I10]